MVNEFSHIMSRVSLLTDFPFMVYEQESGKMLRYKAGVSADVNVPASLTESLADESKILAMFSKNGEPVAAYFLRFDTFEGKRVVVINDSKARVSLNKFFAALSQYCLELRHRNEPMYSEPDNKNNSLESTAHSYNSEIETLKINLTEKNQQIDLLSLDLSEMADLVKIIKKSRDKHCALVDGVFMPMYSVSHEMKLVHGNGALAAFIGIPNISKVIGSLCYKTIFGLEQQCPWCKKNEVEESKAPVTSSVVVTIDGRTCTLNLTGFPILGQNGEIVDHGEFFEDKTDKMEMMSTISQFREQIQNFRPTKVTELNETQDVKAAYQELSANYDTAIECNAKMARTLESLMSYESTKDIISLRSEVVDYKQKLIRAVEAIKSYQHNIEEMKQKHTDLHKRIFFQTERLINTVNSKYNPPIVELKMSLMSLASDFKAIREYFKNADAKK